MKAISFWEMITSPNTTICIPRIQRDYAQGRIGKELLRQRLLMSCKESLDNVRDHSKNLLLDFVYGSKEENGIYYPLDGQQRLTTLWLLHWYIAFNADELNEETRNLLSNFSYETRRSSSDFCEFLCQLKYTSGVLSSKDLRTYISTQTKFSAKWMLDPTVSAMLNTLCGTNITDDNDTDIKDGLAEIFTGSTEEDFKRYFNILRSSDCPIKFYNLDMRGENLPLSDDLYIKMNARGKQLSDWENFKADLLSFVDNKDELGAEIDGCWTDLFWHKQSGGQIDAILFAFINRYIFNEFLCEKNIKGPLSKYSLYDLYGSSGNDTSLRYKDFSRYSNKDVSADVTKRAIANLQRLMCRLSEFIQSDVQRFDLLSSLTASGWPGRGGDEQNSDKFNFFPIYTSGEATTINKININQRLVFLAICRYFEKVEVDEFNDDKFKDWVRFAWNIGEYIRTDAMSNAFQLIDEKSEYCKDIILHLNTSTIDDKSFASEQIKEEIEKAQYILKNPNKKDDILTAERFRDLHGHIGFLFHDDNGNIRWDDFDKKNDRLQTLFGADVGFEKRKDILKIFLSYCTNIEQIESWTNNYSYIYDYSWESWKANFSHTRYIVPTHNLLIGRQMRAIEDAVSSFEKPYSIYTDIYRWMLETDLIEKVAIRLKSGQQRPYLRRYGGKLCLYPSAEGINMERLDRDKVLQMLYNKGLVQLKDEDIFSQPDGGRLFLKGWGINFTYKGYRFYWNWGNKLYINDLEYKSIENGVSEDDFVDLLNSAIDNHENIETEAL